MRNTKKQVQEFLHDYFKNNHKVELQLIKKEEHNDYYLLYFENAGEELLADVAEKIHGKIVEGKISFMMKKTKFDTELKRYTVKTALKE